MRYTTQANTPGAPGNLSPFRFDGLNGLSNVNRIQTPGPRIPVSYGTDPLMGNAKGLVSSAADPQHAATQHRVTTIHKAPEPGPRQLPDVQNVIRQLAAQQGSMPMQPVASRTQGTVGGIGNSAWCN
jgi:hypothetical protein